MFIDNVNGLWKQVKDKISACRQGIFNAGFSDTDNNGYELVFEQDISKRQNHSS